MRIFTTINLIFLKKQFFHILFLLLSISSWGQKLRLEISSSEKAEKTILDSIGYATRHDNAKSIVATSQELQRKLQKIGYFQVQEVETKKLNDTIFRTTLVLGKKNRYLQIIIGDNFRFFGLDSKTKKVATNTIETFMQSILSHLEQNGYALAKIQLTNFRETNNELFADLLSDIEIQRSVQDIVIKGYEKFPKNHLRNIQREFKNKILNTNSVQKVSDAFTKIRFVKQSKSPEILFTKDSTKIYVYLEKNKANAFDGFIGFSNTEKKLQLNGYLDLKLQNILNSGEKFIIYWKSDGNNQKTFDASTEIPYIFNSRLGIKAQLNLFKQDSIFQNAKTAIDLGYYFRYNTKVFLGYQSTESSDIQNTNNSTISDFNNSFITSELEHSIADTFYPLFSEKTLFRIRLGSGKRSSTTTTENQFFGNLNCSHTIYLNKKNSFHIQNQSFYLKSNQYIINELFRFGGINSIRGFNENSLQGNIFSAFLTEYRYHFNQGLYLHSIIDYGYSQDKTSNTNNNLLGIGFGFGLQTKNGFFHFVYANGSTNNQAIKLSNSIVHISFKANF